MTKYETNYLHRKRGGGDGKHVLQIGNSTIVTSSAHPGTRFNGPMANGPPTCSWQMVQWSSKIQKKHRMIHSNNNDKYTNLHICFFLNIICTCCGCNGLRKSQCGSKCVCVSGTQTSPIIELLKAMVSYRSTNSQCNA